MREFEVVALDRSLICKQRIPAGDSFQYRLRFEAAMPRDMELVSASASSTSPVSTVSAPVLWDDHRSLTFFVTANTSFEIFTVSLIVTDTLGQTLNFTIIYEVVGPFTETLTPNPLPVIIGPTGPTGPAGGISSTIVTAPLHNGGNTGSMTFVSGLLTAQTPAT